MKTAKKTVNSATRAATERQAKSAAVAKAKALAPELPARPGRCE